MISRQTSKVTSLKRTSENNLLSASLELKAKEIKLDPGFWTKTSWIQLLYGVWVNMAQLGIGLAFGLSAVQVPQLESPDSHIKVTRDEASWIASILTLFSPIGCLVSGYVTDRFGRRIMLIVCQAPMCAGWLYTGLAYSSKDIIIGRAITGIGCGMAMGPPRIFCTEISLPNMRGVIGAFPNLALSIGLSVQAALGSFFDWHVLCFICCGFTVINLVLFNLLPETPYYILKTGTIEEAKKCLTKFRGANYDIDKEMSQLIDFKADNDIPRKSLQGSGCADGEHWVAHRLVKPDPSRRRAWNTSQRDVSIKLSAQENIKLLFTRASCKPFCIVQTYVLLSQFAGISSILMWAIEILTVANSSVNAHTGNFLMSMTRVIVGTLTSILLFRFGRKPLALTSAVGVSITCYFIGIFIKLNSEPSIIPQISYIAYVAFASLGYYTIPFLLASELYPLQVRGTLGGITVSITSLLIFGCTKLYATMRDNLGLAYTMVMYGTCSVFGVIFLYLFLPETKELTLQEIEEYYNQRRPTLVSERRLMSIQMLAKSESLLSKCITPKNNEKYKSMKMTSDTATSGIVASLQAIKTAKDILENKSNKNVGTNLSATKFGGDDKSDGSAAKESESKKAKRDKRKKRERAMSEDFNETKELDKIVYEKKNRNRGKISEGDKKTTKDESDSSDDENQPSSSKKH